MRKLIYIPGFLIIFISCKQEVLINYMVVSGKILTKAIGELTLNSIDRSFKDTLQVADDGSFVDTLRVKIDTSMLYDGINLS